jgi:hypothetical protein
MQNVLLGVAVMLWPLDYRQVRQMLSSQGRKQAQEQPGI